MDVRVVCLDDAAEGKRWTLAAVGANARRATEDSTTIAYVTTRDPVVVRFSGSILEEAGIAQLPTSSGATAMGQLIRAVDEAGDASNLRESVNESLGDR